MGVGRKDVAAIGSRSVPLFVLRADAVPLQSGLFGGARSCNRG